MYKIYGAVKVPAYVPHFPCAEKTIGTYTVEEFEDYPHNHTAIIKQEIQNMVNKLVAAGYDPDRIYTDVANEGVESYEFGVVRIDDERLIIRTKYNYEY